METGLQVHKQYTQPCFPSYTKRFYKWHPDSKDPFGLQLCGCDVLFGETSSALSFTHMQSTSEGKSAHFCLLSMHNEFKVVSVSSGTKASATLGKNLKGPFFVCVFFFTNDKIQTFERLSVFPECTTDFHVFSETNTVQP